MEATLAAPQNAPSPAVLDLPPASAVPLGDRLGDRLARVPAFDWCHWSEALSGIRLAEVAPALRFAQEAATRVQLAAHEDGVVCVVTLLPRQTLPARAHGESEGILHVLAGQGRCDDHLLWAGDQVSLAPERPCDITNVGPGVLVALALYASSAAPA